MEPPAIRNTPTCVGKTITPPTPATNEKKHPHVRGEDVFFIRFAREKKETPPRAWGRLSGCRRTTVRRRNTPTCVGKTITPPTPATNVKKHPHVRGEDVFFIRFVRDKKETPPRAWGRLSASSRPTVRRRNTPTCVGKTQWCGRGPGQSGKHPHVRGEDGADNQNRKLYGETPPRAWGRLMAADLLKTGKRNTPTCVGKTLAGPFCGGRCWKHPHVRGEDGQDVTVQRIGPETPPRAWGRQPRATDDAVRPGNTPTCVGKTNPQKSDQQQPKKHPHVRGEDPSMSASCGRKTETPPRAWGRRKGDFMSITISRNTPTCVGKTAAMRASGRIRGKHPHVRGEDRPRAAQCVDAPETPPRAWGRRLFSTCWWLRPRNTPTCVGKTASKTSTTLLYQKHPHVRGEDFCASSSSVFSWETPPRAWGRHFRFY